MPNFVADEVQKRYTSAVNPPKWRLAHTVESEIAFSKGRESRTRIVLNGKPWDHPYRMLPSANWSGGFGSSLSDLFGVDCPSTFALDNGVKEHGRSLLVLRYKSPLDGCLGWIHSGYQRFFFEETGRVLFDERQGHVVRLEGTDQGFPPAFPISQREFEVSWDYVKIAGDSHLLPVAADYITIYDSGRMALTRAQYKNHRHFEASSSVTFH
jgi:hypothetical protein